MTFEELTKITPRHTLWSIYSDDGFIFFGHQWDLTHELMEAAHSETFDRIKGREVISLKPCLDISHKQWKEKDLMPPKNRDELAEYEFADLQVTQYMEVQIKSQEQA